MAKNYGTLRYHAASHQWLVECQPYCMIRLKRVFDRAAKDYGTVRLGDTEETCRELLWFMDRFPLEVSPKNRAYLYRRASDFNRKAEEFELILGGKLNPRGFELALPLRKYQAVAAELALRARGLLLADEVGLGKAQPLDAKVLTPYGWKRMGDIEEGDQIVDPDGGTAYVTGVFPRGDREVFRVTTSDGESTECSDDHLWNVMTPNDRVRGTSRVLPLSDLRGALKVRKGSNLCSRWFLPVAQPTTFEEDRSPMIHPYLLGIIIGDGCIQPGSLRVSIGDAETLAYVGSLLPAGLSLKHVPPSRCDYRISRTVRARGVNSVLAEIEALGLRDARSWQKHLPVKALRAPEWYRIELLRGLMDSDGACDAGGASVTFTTTSEALRDGVRELVGSLGGFASVYSRITNYTHRGKRRDGRRSYTLNIRLPVNPFRCRRKADRWRPPYLARAIKSVEPVGVKPVRCISVSSRRGLYVTDGYIVTHNTAVAIGMLCDPATRPALVVTMAHLPLQWKREIEKFAPQLVTHIVRQGTPYNLRVSGRRKKDARETAFPDVLLMNYHKLRGWADTLAGVVRTVVFDEAQELRHTESQKSRAARHIASKADVRIGLSATPIHNYGGEFYNVIDVLRPDVLGSKEEFLREWCDEHVVMGRDKSTIRDPKAFGTYLRENALMLRRTRKEVGRELPPIITIPHDVDCDLAALDKVKSDATALARIILGQDAAWEERGRAARELDARMRRATGIAKAPYVAEFVRMLAESGEKLLLYGWHRSVYDIWLDRLKDLKPVMYTGTESPAAKEAARKAFMEGDARILIMSLRSGAGLDGLQRVCHIAVYGELDWSPAVHIQCTGRVARDGVDESVVAYYLIAREGSDPTVAHVLGVKRQQLEGVIDPDAELVEQLQVDEDHIKKLARAFLERCGERVKEARA